MSSSFNHCIPFSNHLFKKPPVFCGLAEAAFETFDTEPAETFLTRVARYSKALRELEVQSPSTLKMLIPFEEQEWCLVAKGCGAFGEDTALVFYPSAARREVIQFAASQGVEIVATESDLSGGLEVHREAH